VRSFRSKIHPRKGAGRYESTRRRARRPWSTRNRVVRSRAGSRSPTSITRWSSQVSSASYPPVTGLRKRYYDPGSECPSELPGPDGDAVILSSRPGRWSSQRSMVRPGRYTTKSHNRATTKNPTANIRNCQISDSKTFHSATPGTVARYTGSIVHQGCIRRKRVTQTSRLTAPRKADRRPWEPSSSRVRAIASCSGSRLRAVPPCGCRAVLPSCRASRPR
jgi:hypothetical protein